MKLYVIRHGQTPGNVANLMHGRTDDPLSEEGVRQAQRASVLVKQLDYDFVICSPLQRARRTAEIVNASRQKQMLQEDRLMERDCGSLEDKKVTDFNYQDYWNYNVKMDFEGLESIQDLNNRVWGFLDEIKEKYADKNILIVTHNGVCRSINAYFEGIPENGNLQKYKHHNCELRAYEVK